MVELHFGGVLHGLNAFRGCRVFAFGHAIDHVQTEFEKRVCIRVFAWQVTHQWQRCRAHHALCKRYRFLQQTVFGLSHQVKQFLTRQHGEHFTLDRFAADDHVQSCLNTDDTRQSLRTASAGDQSQFDLGQCDIGTGSGHAVMATQRQFQTTTHGHAVNGSNHRFVAVFQGRNDAEQMGLLEGFGRAEFFDVSTP